MKKKESRNHRRKREAVFLMFEKKARIKKAWKEARE